MHLQNDFYVTETILANHDCLQWHAQGDTQGGPWDIIWGRFSKSSSPCTQIGNCYLNYLNLNTEHVTRTSPSQPETRPTRIEDLSGHCEQRWGWTHDSICSVIIHSRGNPLFLAMFSFLTVTGPELTKSAVTWTAWQQHGYSFCSQAQALSSVHNDLKRPVVFKFEQHDYSQPAAGGWSSPHPVMESPEWSSVSPASNQSLSWACRNAHPPNVAQPGPFPVFPAPVWLDPGPALPTALRWQRQEPVPSLLFLSTHKPLAQHVNMQAYERENKVQSWKPKNNIGSGNILP